MSSDGTLLIVSALSMVVAGISVLSVTALTRAVLSHGSNNVTASDSAQVYISQAARDVDVGSRLSDTEIAALEDALSYLSQVRDANEDAVRALDLAALILQLRRGGKYRPSTTVGELNELLKRSAAESECKIRANGSIAKEEKV